MNASPNILLRQSSMSGQALKLRLAARNEERKPSYIKKRNSVARAEDRKNISNSVDHYLESEELYPKQQQQQQQQQQQKKQKQQQLSPPNGLSRLVKNPFRTKKHTKTGAETTENEDKKASAKKTNKKKKKTSTKPKGISKKKQDEKLKLPLHHLTPEETYLETVLDEVLKKYPKEKCQTFSDHKEFAMAELTTYHRSNLYLSPDMFQQVKALLETRLKIALTEDNDIVMDSIASLAEDDSVTDSTKMDEDTTDDEDPHPHRRHAKSAPPKSAPPSALRSGKANNSSSNPLLPESSKCLALPEPRPPSSKFAFRKDTTTTTKDQQQDATSSTAAEDEEASMVPVENKFVMDPSGHMGKYTGTICGTTGKPHGSGQIEYNKKSIKGNYQGEWDQGSWSGFGTHIKPNGDVYQGNFLGDLKHGAGTYRYHDDKRVFEGRHVMGERVDGKMAYGDGSLYKGQWYNSKRHGRGAYRFCDGSKYKGEFAEDKIHGVGQLIWPDGSKFLGEWSLGKRHGTGKEYRANGELRYEGIWKENVPVTK